ncbi:MAG: sigma-70 family RNA polymerase sigma factor [Roseiflexaceae bacterium]
MQAISATTSATQQSNGTARRIRNQAAPNSGIDAADILRMELVLLERHCAIESERFYRGHAHDTRFAYELFRRALVERDQLAWEYIFNHYRGLVESWVRRSGAFASSGETSEFFVVSAFTRFWQAVGPERFESFNSLAALLHYLQLCASCVVIDSVRAQSWAEVMPEEALVYAKHPLISPDEEAMDRVDRAEFWEYINALLNDEAERIVLHSSFVLGMKPADIYQRRPDLFASVNDVYNVKRNILGRLSRNQELRQRFED